jgi:probable blue pigment (indigoidine) exporter
VAVEGPPPALDGAAVAGFGYLTVVATALAFAAWFAGLRHLSAGTVGLIGLLNPVTGVLLGTLVAAETLTVKQLVGLALVLLGVVLGQPAATRAAAAVRRRGLITGRVERRRPGTLVASIDEGASCSVARDKPLPPSSSR